MCFRSGNILIARATQDVAGLAIFVQEYSDEARERKLECSAVHIDSTTEILGIGFLRRSCCRVKEYCWGTREVAAIVRRSLHRRRAAILLPITISNGACMVSPIL
eukprot:scpid99979/ scgid35197/ 